MFWDFRALLGTGSPKVPFGTVNPLQKQRFLGESSGHWAQDLFKTKTTVDPILQTAIFENFRQNLNFPILTCRTTSQPINLKNAQHFHLFFVGTSGMYPIPLACGVYPIRRGLSVSPCSPGWPPWWWHHGAKTKEPNDVQILNITQLESASQTQTAQYPAPWPRLHLPK